MVEPMTEEEIAEMARKTREPIDMVRKAANQLKRIDEIAQKYPDLTCGQIVFTILINDGLVYE